MVEYGGAGGASRYGSTFGSGTTNTTQPSVYDYASAVGRTSYDVQNRLTALSRFSPQLASDPAAALKFVQDTISYDDTGFHDALADTNGFTGLGKKARSFMDFQSQFGVKGPDPTQQRQFRNLTNVWSNLSDGEQTLLRFGYGVSSPEDLAKQWDEAHKKDEGWTFGRVAGAIWDNSFGAALSGAKDLGAGVWHGLGAGLRFTQRLYRMQSLAFQNRVAPEYDPGSNFKVWKGAVRDRWRNSFNEAGHKDGEGAYSNDTYASANEAAGWDNEVSRIAYHMSVDGPGKEPSLADAVDKTVREQLDLHDDEDVAANQEQYRQAYTALYSKVADPEAQKSLDASLKIYNTHHVSFGRDLANGMGMRPTGNFLGPYNLVSGLGDMAFDFYADPLLVGGKIAHGISASRKAVELEKAPAIVAERLGSTFQEVRDSSMKFKDIAQWFDRTGRLTEYGRNGLAEINRYSENGFQRFAHIVLNTFDRETVDPDAIANMSRLLGQTKMRRGIETLVTHDWMTRIPEAARADALGELAKIGVPLKAPEILDASTGLPALDKIADAIYNNENALGHAKRMLLEKYPTEAGIGGIRTADDIVKMFDSSTIAERIMAGDLGNMGKGMTELPELSRAGQAKMRLKLAGENWIDNRRFALHDLLGELGPEDFKDARAQRLSANLQSRVGNFLSRFQHLIPKVSAIELYGADGANELKKLLQFSMPEQDVARWVATYMAAPSANARRAIVSGATEQMMRYMGAQPQYISDFMEKTGEFRQLFSVAGNDLIVGADGFVKHAAIWSNQLAENRVAIPKFRELLKHIDEGNIFQQAYNSTVNSDKVGTLVSRYWKPWTLLRPAFVPRIAGEETLNWMARAGVFTPLRAWVIEPLRAPRIAEGGEFASLPWYLHPMARTERRLNMFREGQWSLKNAWNAEAAASAEAAGIPAADYISRIRNQTRSKYAFASFVGDDGKLTYLDNPLSGLIQSYAKRVFDKAPDAHRVSYALDSMNRYGINDSAYLSAITGEHGYLEDPVEAFGERRSVPFKDKVVEIRPVRGQFAMHHQGDMFFHLVADDYMMRAKHDVTQSAMSAARAISVPQAEHAILWNKVPFDSYEESSRAIGEFRSTWRYHPDLMKKLERAEAAGVTAEQRAAVAKELKDTLSNRNRLTDARIAILDKWGELDQQSRNMLLVDERNAFGDFGTAKVPQPRVITLSVPGRDVTHTVEVVNYQQAWRDVMDQLPEIPEGHVRLTRAQLNDFTTRTPANPDYMDAGVDTAAGTRSSSKGLIGSWFLDEGAGPSTYAITGGHTGWLQPEDFQASFADYHDDHFLEVAKEFIHNASGQGAPDTVRSLGNLIGHELARRAEATTGALPEQYELVDLLDLRHKMQTAHPREMRAIESVLEGARGRRQFDTRYARYVGDLKDIAFAPSDIIDRFPRHPATTTDLYVVDVPQEIVDKWRATTMQTQAEANWMHPGHYSPSDSEIVLGGFMPPDDPRRIAYNQHYEDVYNELEQARAKNVEPSWYKKADWHAKYPEAADQVVITQEAMRRAGIDPQIGLADLEERAKWREKLHRVEPELRTEIRAELSGWDKRDIEWLGERFSDIHPSGMTYEELLDQLASDIYDAQRDGDTTDLVDLAYRLRDKTIREQLNIPDDELVNLRSIRETGMLNGEPLTDEQKAMVAEAHRRASRFSPVGPGTPTTRTIQVNEEISRHLEELVRREEAQLKRFSVQAMDGATLTKRKELVEAARAGDATAADELIRHVGVGARSGPLEAPNLSRMDNMHEVNGKTVMDVPDANHDRVYAPMGYERDIDDAFRNMWREGKIDPRWSPHLKSWIARQNHKSVLDWLNATPEFPAIGGRIMPVSSIGSTNPDEAQQLARMFAESGVGYRSDNDTRVLEPMLGHIDILRDTELARRSGVPVSRRPFPEWPLSWRQLDQTEMARTNPVPIGSPIRSIASVTDKGPLPRQMMNTRELLWQLETDGTLSPELKSNVRAMRQGLEDGTYIKPGERGPDPTLEYEPFDDPHADWRSIDLGVQAAADEAYGPAWRAYVNDHADHFAIYPDTPVPDPVHIHDGKPVTVHGVTYQDALRSGVDQAFSEINAIGVRDDGRIAYDMLRPVGNRSYESGDTLHIDWSAMPNGIPGPVYQAYDPNLWEKIVTKGFEALHPMIASISRHPQFLDFYSKFLPEAERVLVNKLADPEAEQKVLDLFARLDGISPTGPKARFATVEEILAGHPDAAAHGVTVANRSPEAASQLDTLHGDLEGVFNRDRRKIPTVENFATSENEAVQDAIYRSQVDENGMLRSVADQMPQGIHKEWNLDELHPVIAEVIEPVVEAQRQYLEAVEAHRLSRVQQPELLSSLKHEFLAAREQANQDIEHLATWWHGRDKAFQRAAEVSAERAMNEMLPYIHDPAVRSQFHELGRNVFPFWFAEEQFYKRWAKVIVEHPEGLRELQLMFRGLRSGGIIREDEYGNEIYNIPGADIADKALAPVWKWVFGTDQTVPVVSGLTGEVQYTVPGAEDLGLPHPGPLVAVPLSLAAQKFPELSSWQANVLGERAEGKAWTDSLLPSSALRLWRATHTDSKSREYTAAMLNAMSQLAAAGLQPDENASAREKEQYLSRVKNWTRNMLVIKSIYGLISPASPQIEFADDLTPEFRKLMAHAGSYEDAVNLFVKANPDATPYTLFHSHTDSGAPLPATHPAQEWLNAHKDLADKYPLGVPWLIPEPETTDEYQSRAYREQLAEGFRQLKTPDEFYDEVVIARDAPDYWNAKYKVDKQIAQAEQAGDADLVSYYKDKWKADKQLFFAQHPQFADSLQQPDSKQRRETILSQVRELVSPGGAFATAPAQNNIRELITAYDKIQAQISQYNSYGTGLMRTMRDDYRTKTYKAMLAFVNDHPDTLSFWQRVLQPEMGLNEYEQDQADLALTGGN